MGLSSALSGGPCGVGDPNDRSLRKVEKEILIPQKIRDRTKAEKCIPEVAAFSSCCKNSGLAMIFKCRQENTTMQECLGFWYKNEEFINECTEEYLKERSEFRKTGLSKTQRKKHTSSF